MSKNTNLSFLTDYITADITNGRIGINNASPTVAFDVSGATRISGALTLTSTISNGTYTYTLPSATGTLALTSAISGTTNYVPKFTASGTIGNSQIFDNGTAVGIGTSSPGSLFDVTNIVSTAYDSTNSIVSGQTMRIANTSTTSGISANLLFIATGGGGGNGIGTISGVNTGTGSLALTFATRDAGGSIAERMRITSAGLVGIGTTAPNYTLHIDSNTTLTRFQITNSTTGQGGGVGLQIIQNGLDASITNRSNGYLGFETVGTERMRITSAGDVGIGTTSPAVFVEISKNQNASTITRISNTTSGTGAYSALHILSSAAVYLYNFSNAYTTSGKFAAGTFLMDISTLNGININTSQSAPILFSTTDAERMRITSAGNVGIGTTTPGVKLEVNGGGAAVAMTIATSGATTAGCLWDGGGAPSFHAWSRPDDCGIGSNNFAGKSILIKTGMSYGSFTTGTTRIEIQSSGAVVIPGSLSKGSGSFRIDHPLKPDTHQLVHSFIEGPQADLIYRGKLTLVNGKAQANIDEVSTMTEGTFEALCRDVQCFTTNENGWDLVKGKVIGNIIYIESQNPNSTDEISWMVIGERKDKHMMDTEWTDEQGKVIVEPLKA